MEGSVERVAKVELVVGRGRVGGEVAKGGDGVAKVEGGLGLGLSD
eukprot:CAMPEP_0184649554 /NCGR_PEP_ID=MMETSP0308-20130426/6959_1 /TAXON_ID=38269 /ORGANISM="Gloeochaete witrockiana, Strain SAG 46.84" /LENGTH=44 /DNA_ID= /DNA_START= /DNA_END= /DNA_ORIENTATION=